MLGAGQACDPLALEGDADQQRAPVRDSAAAKECERPIVVTASHAEAHAPPIDADERHEDGIEVPRIDARPRSRGLADAVRARRKQPSRAGEDHEMPLRILDAGQIEAAAGTREASHCRREIGLAGQRLVGRDVAQDRRQSRGESPGDREGMTSMGRGVERGARGAQLAPE